VTHDVGVFLERLLVLAKPIQCLATVLLKPNTLIVVNSNFIARIFEEDADNVLAFLYFTSFDGIACRDCI